MAMEVVAVEAEDMEVEVAEVVDTEEVVEVERATASEPRPPLLPK